MEELEHESREDRGEEPREAAAVEEETSSLGEAPEPMEDQGGDEYEYDEDDGEVADGRWT